MHLHLINQMFIFQLSIFLCIQPLFSLYFQLENVLVNN